MKLGAMLPKDIRNKLMNLKLDLETRKIVPAARAARSRRKA